MPFRVRRRRGHRDHLLGIDHRLVGAAVRLLELLGVTVRDAKSLHQIAGNGVAAVRDRAEMPDFPLVKHGEIGGAGPEFDQDDAELFFFLGEHSQRTGQRLEHEFARFVTGALDTLAQVHGGRGPHWYRR